MKLALANTVESASLMPMPETFKCRAICELCGSDRKSVLISREFSDSSVWSFLDDYYEGRISKSDLADGKYEIAKCVRCGFIWQTHILADELMKKLYSIWIASEQSLLKKKGANLTLFSTYAREAESIAFLLSKKPCEISVLDFGMGWGYWCLMAKAFGYNVSGFEISRERIGFARKNGINVIEDLSLITTPNFDFINATEVFEHIPNPLQTLKSLVCTLKDQGIIHISVPNGKAIEKKIAKPGWKATKNAIQPLEHINCFKHRTIGNLGKSAGLKLIKQPLLLGPRRYGLKSYFVSFLAKYYRQYFGTSLYFRKINSNSSF